MAGIPKKEIIYHLMRIFNGIKIMLVTWSIIISLLSKIQNTEKKARPHNSDVTTIILHLMQNFLGIQNILVMWSDWKDQIFQKRKSYLIWCRLFWASTILQSHDLCFFPYWVNCKLLKKKTQYLTTLMSPLSCLIRCRIFLASKI